MLPDRATQGSGVPHAIQNAITSALKRQLIHGWTSTYLAIIIKLTKLDLPSVYLYNEYQLLSADPMNELLICCVPSNL